MDAHAISPHTAENSFPTETTEPPTRITRMQTLTLISMASVNFSSMICYSILGPFFPYEAVKKGASQTVIGLIFGSYALCNLIGSMVMGKYIVQIGAKFMLIAGLFVSAVCTILFGNPSHGNHYRLKSKATGLSLSFSENVSTAIQESLSSLEAAERPGVGSCCFEAHGGPTS
ncbi:hypothetical protein CRENBAI_008296 [Crenichthys baileyi]|uniref:Major facilitator superfamily (MFS) profile domain-containing protein n=1 Tax=Crenichthys baileyi TaxID=28760 RepID=A0AAV9SQT7_9TELE